jgi:hypothetical protein
MKIIFYSCCSFLLLSCSPYQIHLGTENKKSITDIPLRPHHNKVDLFFGNELPLQPYYKVQMVDAELPANASYDALLKQLIQNAQAMGVDGLMIENRIQTTHYSDVQDRIDVKDTSYYLNRQVASSYQQLSAIGIRYLSTINYLDTIVKQVVITEFNNGQPGTWQLNFDFYGNLLANADTAALRFYSHAIEPFDVVKHFKGTVANWAYSYDVNNKIQAYQLVKGEEVMVKARLDMLSTPTQQVVQYVCKDVAAGSIKYTLECYFDYNGNLVEKQLYHKKKLLWKEQPTYSKQKPTGYVRYAYQGLKQIKLLEAKYDFYQHSDLPAPLPVK